MEKIDKANLRVFYFAKGQILAQPLHIKIFDRQNTTKQQQLPFQAERICMYTTATVTVRCLYRLSRLPGIRTEGRWPADKTAFSSPQLITQSKPYRSRNFSTKNMEIDDQDLKPHSLKFDILTPLDPSTPNARLGKLSVTGRKDVETPNFFAVSSRGVVPHLTPDVILAHTQTGGIHMALEDCEPLYT